MRLFLNNNHNIAWLHAWVLIGLAVEDVLLVVRGAFVDFCLNYLFLLDDLFTIASLTFVLFINYLAFTIAIIAGALGLGVHAWSEHLHSGYHATTFATSALLYSAFFSTLTFTLCADSLTIDCYFGLLSTVYFFKSDF